MMKVITSQLLLEDFGKIGVFIKLRESFENNQN